MLINEETGNSYKLFDGYQVTRGYGLAWLFTSTLN